jgi:hypothetical protein
MALFSSELSEAIERFIGENFDVMTCGAKKTALSVIYLPKGNNLIG